MGDDHSNGSPGDTLGTPRRTNSIILNALLRRGALHRANIIRIADLEIDRGHHQVRRNGAGIKLTSKEYSLLEYLALNAGRVLSRSMIVDHVWDQSFDGLTNIVDVYVRQALEEADVESDAAIRSAPAGSQSVELRPKPGGSTKWESTCFFISPIGTEDSEFSKT